MLLGAAVFAATVGGMRGGLLGGLLASVYLVFAGLREFGAEPLSSHPLRFLAGVCVIMLVALSLGQLQGRNSRLYRSVSDRMNSRMRSLVREAPEAICVLDAETGRMVEGNPIAHRIFELAPQEFRGKSVAELSPERQPDGRSSETAAAEYVRQALATGVATFEWWHRSAGGREFPCEVSLSALKEGSQRLVRGNVRDISARKRAELQRSAEHTVLESIASGDILDETLDKLALSVERILPGAICTVLLLDEDGVHVRHGASPSVSDVFRTAIDGESIGPEAGSCGTAMYLDTQVITEDIRVDPKWKPWRPVAEAEGVRACWSTPIHGSSGDVVGSFAVYFREPRAPGNGELDTLGRMRNLAGIAIERYRNAEALRHREALYRATFEQAAVGIAHIAPDGRYMKANAKFCELVGYTEAELLQMNFRDVTYPEDRKRDDRHVSRMLQGKQDTYHVEKRYRRKDGEVVWVNLSAGAVRRPDGDVERFVVVAEDISAARMLSEELSYQARHDALTGLINRNEFEYRLRQFLAEVLEDRETGAVCYLDLDQFKLVNDTAGHVAGDEMLRQLAPELKRRIRSSDTLARLGGDEFGVLLKGCDTADAIEVADKMRRAVEEFPFIWGDKTFRLGVSIGVVPLRGNALPTVTEILQAADAVCYTAKDSGRNKTVVWREDDAAIYRRHGEMQWVPRLNQAMDERLFVMLAQPIVPVGQGRERDHAWYELLLRLKENGELVAPGAFLPAAERYGLAPRLDRMVVENALAWLAAHDRRSAPIRLSVNLSGASLGDEGFRDFLTSTLGSGGFDGRDLCFEITETAAISNLNEAVATMEAIREYGCRVALDDFGSGLSSFAYLKNLPVDYLKIDGVFVRDVINDPVDRAIVMSIQEVSRVMGKKTIAEFVESRAIFEALKELGVDYAQGYWTGEPVPIESVDRFLRS